MTTYLITLAAVLTGQVIWFLLGRWAVRSLPTCAACGAMYHRKADLLKHIETCPEHPLRKDKHDGN
jgi:membrane protein DedA with SNARE-associated domain